MQARTFEDNKGTKYQRINKATARKMFDAGQTIVVCPVNMHPFGYWGMGYEATKAGRYQWDKFDDFDKLCANASYYGCSYETGYYLAFYAAI